MTRASQIVFVALGSGQYNPPGKGYALSEVGLRNTMKDSQQYRVIVSRVNNDRAYLSMQRHCYKWHLMLERSRNL